MTLTGPPEKVAAVKKVLRKALQATQRQKLRAERKKKRQTQAQAKRKPVLLSDFFTYTKERLAA